MVLGTHLANPMITDTYPIDPRHMRMVLRTHIIIRSIILVGHSSYSNHHSSHRVIKLNLFWLVCDGFLGYPINKVSHTIPMPKPIPILSKYS